MARQRAAEEELVSALRSGRARRRPPTRAAEAKRRNVLGDIVPISERHDVAWLRYGASS